MIVNAFGLAVTTNKKTNGGIAATNNDPYTMIDEPSNAHFRFQASRKQCIHVGRCPIYVRKHAKRKY
jgi:hypothetical protein